MGDWTNNGAASSIDDLKSLLKSFVVAITFKKVDGSTRIMNATTRTAYVNSRLIWQAAQKKNNPQTKKRKQREEDPFAHEKQKLETTNLVVWDIEKDNWRSIRPDSIISTLILPE